MQNVGRNIDEFGKSTLPISGAVKPINFGELFTLW